METEHNNEETIENPRPRPSVGRRAISLISIEPAIFLASLGYGFQSVISQNLIIDKVCLNNLHISMEQCENLTANKTLEEEVQKVAATITMYQSILTAIPAVIVSLFLGPWSDVNGRKPLMVVPMFGTLVSQLVYIINTYFFHWNAEYVLVTSIGSLFGGFTGFLIGMYSYISDVSSGRARTSRVALIDLFMFLGFPVGTFVSGPVFKYGGYYSIFGLAAGFTFLSMLYVMFIIKDTRGPYSVLTTSSQASYDILGAFSIWNLLEVFKAFFKPRENYVRMIMMLLVLGMLFNLSTISASSLVYLFTRLKFDWSEQDFTVWVAASTVASSFASFLVMPLLSYRLKMHDTLIGIIGAFFGVAANLIRAFAPKAWLLYLSSVVALMSTTPPIVIRSYLSKVTPADELGRIFSLVASLEACVPLITSPIMTLIYNSTLDFFPGAIILTNVFLYIFIIVILSIVYYLVRITQDRPIVNEETANIIDNEEEPSNDS